MGEDSSFAKKAKVNVSLQLKNNLILQRIFLILDQNKIFEYNQDNLKSICYINMFNFIKWEMIPVFLQILTFKINNLNFIKKVFDVFSLDVLLLFLERTAVPEIFLVSSLDFSTELNDLFSNLQPIEI